MSNQWERLGNAQKAAYPQNMPGAINNRIPFMLAKDAAQNVPKNPGSWNDAIESARVKGVDLLGEAVKYGPLTGAAIGSFAGPVGIAAGAAIGTVPLAFAQIDKATNGDFSKLLMAGAGNVRSNYAFARDLGSKNAALGILSGLFTATGAILGGAAGFVGTGFNPLGAAAGASLGAATAGKLQREVAQTDFVKRVANELYRSSKFAEQDVGQESYNFGRDITRFAGDVVGSKTLGDTSKGIGAITSGILNFGFEVTTGPDVALFKGVGAVARPALVGASITPERTGLFAKVLSKKTAEEAAKRAEADIDLIKRTVAGEETSYTPVFKFYRENPASVVMGRPDFKNEMGQIAAHLVAGADDETIGLILRVGRYDNEAIDLLGQKSAAKLAEYSRIDDAIRIAEEGGQTFVAYKGQILNASKTIPNTLDFLKKEVASLKKESDFWTIADDSLKGSMTDRTVSRFAWVERLRNDLTKERAARKFELNKAGAFTSAAGRTTDDLLRETRFGGVIQGIYQKSPFSVPIRWFDRATDDAPRDTINFNDVIVASDRMRANIRGATRYAGLDPKAGLTLYDEFINATDEITKYNTVKKYTDTLAEALSKKYDLPASLIDEILSAWDESHKAVLLEAKTASIEGRTYMIAKNGDPIEDPQLISQLANGAYLPNPKEWDKAFARYKKKYGAEASLPLQAGLTSKYILDEFGSLWRTFTLLRAGYPTNIIRDSSVRMLGDGALFPVLKILSEDALHAITNSSNTRKNVRSATSTPKASENLANIRNDIYVRDETILALQQQLDEANVDTRPFSVEEHLNKFPDVFDYKDGGSGGLPGTRSTVGFVRVSALKDMPGNVTGNKEVIASYRKSLREGKGFAIRDFQGKPYNDPIMVVYDNETGLAFVGEGNHRLQAAIAEGIEYVPVRVVRGYKSEMISDKKRGQFPQQIKNEKEPKFVETAGSSAGKPVSEGYVPPEMHPSYVFDDKYILNERSTRAELSEEHARAVKYLNDLKATVAALRTQENAIVSGAPAAKRISKDKYIVAGYEFPAARSGSRFADISMQQLRQKEDLRRALASIRELEVSNLRRSRTGSRTIEPRENEQLHLISWENILKDEIGNDPVARIIMTPGKTFSDVNKFLRNTPEGQQYLSRMGKRPSDTKEIYTRVVDTLKQFAPTRALHKMIMDDAVSVDALRKLYPDIDTRPLILTDLVKDMLGTSNAYLKGTKLLRQGVEWLSTAPTSKLMYAPYFAVKYEQKLQNLVFLATREGRKLTLRDREQFERLARQFAIGEYRNKLNAFHRDMNYSGMVNYLIAFFPAVVEQFRAYGRITLEHPDFLPKAVAIKQIPERVFSAEEDPFGQASIEVELPVLGLTARVPAEWFNVFNPTGSSILGAGPVAAAGWNEFVNRFGGEDKVTQRVTEWVLPFGVQAKSAQALLPNTVRRLSQLIVAATAKNGPQFNRDVNMFLKQQNVDFLRDNGRAPTALELEDLSDEAKKDALLLSTVRFLSSLTLPAQPRYVTALQPYADELARMRKEDPINGEEEFINQNPDLFLLADSLSEATSGLRSDDTAVALVKKNPELVSDLVAIVGDDNLTILGAIFNDDDYAFSSKAQAYLERNAIPNTAKKFRDTAAAFDSARSSYVSQGWNEWNKFVTAVEDEVRNGIGGEEPYNPNRGYGKSIVDYYKKDFLEQLKVKNPIWFQEYDSYSGGGGASRQARLVDALSYAINDDKMWKSMSKNPRWIAVAQYLNFRYDVNAQLKQMGTTIDSSRAGFIREDVAEFVDGLKRQDPMFSKFYERYFSNDKFDHVYGG